jgi:hypothetical protein
MYISTSAKKIVSSIVFIFYIVFSQTLIAQPLSNQKLDSLYNKFILLRAPELLPKSDRFQELTIEDKKCGFQIVNYLNSNLGSFSTEKQKILKPLLQRPVLDKSIVTPSGFFRIHYDTSGFSVPSYNPGLSIEENIAEVVKTLDSVYNFEIGFLDYPSPPSDNGSGGDDKYDIYIVNQGGGLYGYTEWESKVGANNWTSFMVIDNDYTGYFSSGINGLKATIAHEFHHGIQVGNYGIENSNAPYRNSDVFFYEITSTAMEEFVYNEVNDYYQYMDSYFRRTDRAFPLHNGYNLAVWNIFLEKRFGFDLLKQQWELIPNQFAITAINNSLILFGSTYPRELNEFGIWTYYTSYNSVPGLYFEEAIYYPLVIPTTTIQFNPPSQQADMNSAPVANNFIRFNVLSNMDTLYTIITNGDAGAAASNPNQFFPFQYTLFSNGDVGDRKLTDDYSSNFSVSNGQFWSVSEILNNIIVRRDSVINTTTGSNNYAFPNPFSYTKNSSGSLIYFALDTNDNETVDINVYTSGMQLVYNAEESIRTHPYNGQKVVSWNGFDNDGKKLASGVYIYVIKRGDDVETGKVVIFNE